MTLRTRLMLHLNGLLLVTVALIAGLTLFTTVQSLRGRARRDALGTASLLASAASPAVSPFAKTRDAGSAASAHAASAAAVQHLVQNVIDAGNLKAIFVTDPQGRLIASATPAQGVNLHRMYGEELVGVALDVIHTLKPSVQFRGDVVEAAVPLPGFGGRPGSLICWMNTRRLDEAISSSLRDILLLSVGGLVAGALLASVLAKRISGPVHDLALAAKKIGVGEFHHRVRVTSRDEIGTLAESFNRMADSLDTYTEKLAHAMAENKVLQREMDIAAEIQQSLLPETCPQLEHFEVAARSVPAREVGGDFYDFIPLPEGRWGVVVADASGKGVPAALLMALSRSLIRAYSQERPSILRALETANAFIVRDVGSGMFVTCFYAVVDPAERKLTYVNAGHNPAVVTGTEGQVVMLRASGTPLGVLEELTLREETCQLHPEDVVILYTDGITEAQNVHGEQFGVQRLAEVARNSHRYTATEIHRRLLTAVQTFAGGQPQFDDMTAVVLKVL